MEAHTAATEQVRSEQSMTAQVKELFHNKAARVVAIGSAAVFAVSMFGGKAKEALVGDSASADGSTPVECQNINLTNQSFDYQNSRGEHAFLPQSRTEIADDNSSAEYTRSLFDSDGPLAKNADPASLAVVRSAITSRALGESTNNEDSYENEFDEALGQMHDQDTADETAAQICEEANQVMGRTVGFEENAIDPGQEFVRFRPVFKNGRLVGLKLERRTARGDAIEGTTYKLRINEQTAKIDGEDVEMSGFNKVVVEPDGDIDVLGPIPEGGKEGKEGKGGRQPSKRQAKSGAQKQQQQSQSNGGGQNNTNGTGPGQQTTGNNGGGTTEGAQGCGNPGAVRCGGGQGQEVGEGGGGGQGTGGGGGGGGQPEAPAPAPAPAPSPEGPAPAPAPSPTPEQPSPSPSPSPSPTPPGEGKGSDPGTPDSGDGCEFCQG